MKQTNKNRPLLNCLTSVRHLTRKNSVRLSAKLAGSRNLNSRKYKRVKRILQVALLSVTLGALYYYRVPFKNSILSIGAKLSRNSTLDSNSNGLVAPSNKNTWNWSKTLNVILAITCLILLRFAIDESETTSIPVKTKRVVTTEPVNHPLLYGMFSYLTVSTIWFNITRFIFWYTDNYMGYK